MAAFQVEALVFDVFGTVVDWRASIADEGRKLGKAKGITADLEAFADYLVRLVAVDVGHNTNPTAVVLQLRGIQTTEGQLFKSVHNIKLTNPMRPHRPPLPFYGAGSRMRPPRPLI